MAAVHQGIGGVLEGNMSKRGISTCDDCYFRREGLCALPGNTPCPTFREANVGRLTPPTQPRLIVRSPIPHVYVASA
jgi:hypothetical protein